MSQNKKKSGSIGSIFMHADGADLLLMALGFIAAIGDGALPPVLLIAISKIMNNHGGSSSTSTVHDFNQKINKNALILCYMASAQFVASFLEGYCWTRTAERQASRLRVRYLKAVLRQDVGYFDLHVSSTSEVITSVSSDSLVIQDVIAEKVHVFIMYTSSFIGSYVVAFMLIWKLAVLSFPFMVLLAIPGLMYGRALIGIARKMKDEYSKADAVVFWLSKAEGSMIDHGFHHDRSWCWLPAAVGFLGYTMIDHGFP